MVQCFQNEMILLIRDRRIQCFMVKKTQFLCFCIEIDAHVHCADLNQSTTKKEKSLFLCVNCSRIYMYINNVYSAHK